MPALEKIVVKDFRNIALQELEFSPNVNCVSGDNGEGKTNLLDAVWYLSMTKSAFSSNDKFNFRHGCKSFSIGGTYKMENGTLSRFAVQVQEGEKKLLRDQKPYTKISDHIGVLPIVMVSPADISLVSEGGEDRRRFVNAVLSQMDREYLSWMQRYNQLLATRNMALKSEAPEESLLEVLDSRLEEYAERIHQARSRFVKDLEPAVQEYYRMLSSDSEKVGIDYRSDLEKGPLKELLLQSRERDRFLKYTSVGIQKDDFVFTMDGHPIRKCGSQGQQKSFLVSLKFAQYEIMKKSYGFPPILLLDDLFDKLDMKRVANLLKMVAGSDFGQIFITDSNKLRMDTLLNGVTAEKACFQAVGGVFTRQDG